MRDPSVEACKAVIFTMQRGSAKDGCDESWRQRPEMYHLAKAMNHLATHINQLQDPRKVDGENHLENAITRIAMALSQG